ncbi:hypothetical protein JT358_04560 [Micrococcales bacterium 31B]|nr:hypothetical protein [Micrococcales bacterium 31B]
MNTTKRPRTWGTSKIGGGTTPALFHAVPLGAAVSLLIGALFWQPWADDASLVRGLIYVGCTLVPAIALAWVAVLRSDSMPDHLEHFEQSVESQWSRTAGYNAFVAIACTGALGLFVAWLLPTQAALAVAACCLTILLVGWATFGVSWLKLRGRD